MLKNVEKGNIILLVILRERSEPKDLRIRIGSQMLWPRYTPLSMTIAQGTQYRPLCYPCSGALWSPHAQCLPSKGSLWERIATEDHQVAIASPGGSYKVRITTEVVRTGSQ